MPSKGDPAAPERVYVALGSNLGDRAGHLQRARDALASLPRTRLIAASSIEETAPLGGKQQPPYLNQMVLLETGLEPHALLEACQAIERGEGRERAERWGSRTLDLDIVKFGTRQRSGPRPYHSPSRAVHSRLLAARAGGTELR